MWCYDTTRRHFNHYHYDYLSYFNSTQEHYKRLNYWLPTIMTICCMPFLFHTIPYHTTPYHSIPHHIIPYVRKSKNSKCMCIHVCMYCKYVDVDVDVYVFMYDCIGMFNALGQLARRFLQGKRLSGHIHSCPCSYFYYCQYNIKSEKMYFEQRK